MSISKEQAIEAIKTLKEYCEKNTCMSCGIRKFCDFYFDQDEHVFIPIDWEVPND